MDDPFDAYDDAVVALGIVPTTGRGRLPFALLHGEPLLVWASSALEDAGVDLLDFDVDWDTVRVSGRPVVVHDPLCPATPSGFVAEAVRVALAGDVVVVGVRPVTDTLKRVDADLVGATVDRDVLVRLASPVVLPPRVVAAAEQAPDLDDLLGWVARLRTEQPVELLEAPALAARLADDADLEVLEAAFDPGAR